MEMTMKEWPIYLLADYESSGQLLDECSKLLSSTATTNHHHHHHHHETSDSSGKSKSTVAVVDSDEVYEMKTNKHQEMNSNGNKNKNNDDDDDDNGYNLPDGVQQVQQQQQPQPAKLDSNRKSISSSSSDSKQMTTMMSERNKLRESAYPAGGSGGGCNKKQKKTTTATANATSTSTSTSLMVEWWQLIEKDEHSSNNNNITLAAGRQAVLKLCSTLHSPYLTTCAKLRTTTTTTANKTARGNCSLAGWRSRGSRSFNLIQQSQLKSAAAAAANSSRIRVKSYDDNETMTMNLPPAMLFDTDTDADNGVGGLELSAASLRRLSWRRHLAAVKPPQIGRTFSRPIHHNDEHEKQEQQIEVEEEEEEKKTIGDSTLLSKWIDSTKETRMMINRKAIWSSSSSKRGKYGETLLHILLIIQQQQQQKREQKHAECLILIIVLCHLFPLMIGDIFESLKFRGLNCLHLCIAYGDKLLLDYLLSLDASGHHRHADGKLIDGRVTGSLFIAPSIFSMDRNKCKVATNENKSSVADSFISEKRNKANKQTSSIFWPLNRNVKVSAKRTHIEEDEHYLTTTKMMNMNDDLERKKYWCDQMIHWPTADGHAHLLLWSEQNESSLQQKQQQQQQQQQRKQNQTDNNWTSSSQIVYLGDSPLAWSVSLKKRTIFESLIDKGGANLQTCDSNGHSCLHMLVINNQIGGWARFLIKSGLNSKLENSMGQTAFLMACHYGRAELFDEFLDLTAVEFWSYSMIRCCGYPLVELDSIQEPANEENDNEDDNDDLVAILDAKPKSRSNDAKSNLMITKQAAVCVILESKFSSNEQKSQLLSSAVVKKLLEEKWRLFARRLFYNDLLLTLIHLLLLSVLISLRPMRTDDRTMMLLSTTTTRNHPQTAQLELNFFSRFHRTQLVRHVSELTVFSLSTNQLARFLREWRRFRNLATQWTYNPLLANMVLANGLIVLCLPARLIGSKRAEDILLMLAAPLLWSTLLHFLAAFKITGPFVAMIRYMIVRDLKQFSLIYLIFAYAFAQSIFFVNNRNLKSLDNVEEGQEEEEEDKQNLNHQANLIKHYLTLWMELFKMTLNVYDLQPFRHSIIARLFMLLFIYLISILFNMLIAMMNNTYSLIISQSERAWSFQWARTLFALERQLSQKQAVAYLRKYSINMVDPTRKKTSSDNDNDHDNVNNNDHHHHHEDEVKQDLKESVRNGKQEEQEEPMEQKDCFVPALMIIKRMNYTRAERRRLILSYWQRSIRKILLDIKADSATEAEAEAAAAPPAPL